jgi:hypothetical protein
MRRTPIARGGAASLLLALVLCAAPNVALAAGGDSGPFSKFFFGISAAVCTLVYTPLKIVYAVTSMPMGGLVYTFSVGNTEMSERVLRSGTQGSWVITPDHLRGNRSVTFVGAAEEGPGKDARR